MKEFSFIQQIVSKYAMGCPEWRLVRRFAVIEWNWIYNVGIIEKEHLSDGRSYILFHVLFPSQFFYNSGVAPDSCEPATIFIRDYFRLETAVEAFGALTK